MIQKWTTVLEGVNYLFTWFWILITKLCLIEDYPNTCLQNIRTSFFLNLPGKKVQILFKALDIETNFKFALMISETLFLKFAVYLFLKSVYFFWEEGHKSKHTFKSSWNLTRRNENFYILEFLINQIKNTVEIYAIW